MSIAIQFPDESRVHIHLSTCLNAFHGNVFFQHIKSIWILSKLLDKFFCCRNGYGISRLCPAVNRSPELIRNPLEITEDILSGFLDMIQCIVSVGSSTSDLISIIDHVLL